MPWLPTGHHELARVVVEQQPARSIDVEAAERLAEAVVEVEPGGPVVAVQLAEQLDDHVERVRTRSDATSSIYPLPVPGGAVRPSEATAEASARKSATLVARSRSRGSGIRPRPRSRRCCSDHSTSPDRHARQASAAATRTGVVVAAEAAPARACPPSPMQSPPAGPHRNGSRRRIPPLGGDRQSAPCARRADRPARTAGGERVPSGSARSGRARAAAPARSAGSSPRGGAARRRSEPSSSSPSSSTSTSIGRGPCRGPPGARPSSRSTSLQASSSSSGSSVRLDPQARVEEVGLIE